MQNPTHLSTPNEAPITGMSALELAQAHVADFEVSDPEQIQQIEEAVMLVAESLHQSGGTLAWERLDPDGFFARIAFMSVTDQMSFAQILMGFYLWLACRSLTPASASLNILDGLADRFPHSANLEQIRLFSQPLLRHLSKMETLN